MVDINFDALLRTEGFIGTINARLRDATPLWMDMLAPFVSDEIDAIFDSGGYGRWAGLDPLYAARKGVTHPGKGILEREGTYREAVTPPNSVLEVGPAEMVLGVQGLGYPAFHEEGTEHLSARPVYELITAGERFAERVSHLGEDWQREEIALLERSLR